MVLNCNAEAAKKLISLFDLPTDATSAVLNEPYVDLLIDENGNAGRIFGVGQGWRPEDDNEGLFGLESYVKLFGVLWGLGAWAIFWRKQQRV